MRINDLYLTLQVAQAAECARAAELRAQVAKHNALEQAARRDTRAQCHKLLEEIKSKERVIIQLRREVARTTSQYEQALLYYGSWPLVMGRVSCPVPDVALPVIV
ncbi:unnamed protein product [Pieris macdunnoughi]|uniref:Uncharacterized protein n=1 Tax=Pieris macdunnoughi TaxID=345717 RepID=A0A821S518_9NEOP|nr:unnamed protein product [Pieris macdunnoughi]